MTECRIVRDALSQERLSSTELRAHLESCPSCSRIEELWAAYRNAIPKRRVDVDLGPSFAARVLARREDPWTLLGWGALRLLPVAFCLVLVLSWAAFTAPISSSEILTKNLEDEVFLNLLLPSSKDVSP